SFQCLFSMLVDHSAPFLLPGNVQLLKMTHPQALDGMPCLLFPVFKQSRPIVFGHVRHWMSRWFDDLLLLVNLSVPCPMLCPSFLADSLKRPFAFPVQSSSSLFPEHPASFLQRSVLVLSAQDSVIAPLHFLFLGQRSASFLPLLTYKWNF